MVTLGQGGRVKQSQEKLETPNRHLGGFCGCFVETGGQGSKHRGNTQSCNSLGYFVAWEKMTVSWVRQSRETVLGATNLDDGANRSLKC